MTSATQWDMIYVYIYGIEKLLAFFWAQGNTTDRGLQFTAKCWKSESTQEEEDVELLYEEVDDEDEDDDKVGQGSNATAGAS